MKKIKRIKGKDKTKKIFRFNSESQTMCLIDYYICVKCHRG